MSHTKRQHEYNLSPDQLKAGKELLERMEKDPEFLITKLMGVELWDVESKIINSIWENKRTTVRGCHGLGKTFTAASLMFSYLLSHSKSTVITTAPSRSQVENIFWKEARNLHAKSAYPIGGEILKSKFLMAEDLYAVGFSTKNPVRFQGYHSPNILVIVDEASGINDRVFEGIEGTLASGNAKLLLLGVPSSRNDEFFKSHNSNFYNKIHVSCFDTPNFKPFRAIDTHGRVNIPESLKKLGCSSKEDRKQAIVKSYLTNPEWVYEKMKDWGVSSDLFRTRCLGEFPN